ncbi:hypothetical protein OIU85_025282 [Salix viminalis]|uniref:Uncharacterized protein n=1 Tax=Salix viminalis TaxID=40686 RepID=A0A9Q0TL67_SALVM|nr:hypothetical protein OIU85_025282 [Salix viminalis]
MPPPTFPLQLSPPVAVDHGVYQHKYPSPLIQAPASYRHMKKTTEWVCWRAQSIKIFFHFTERSRIDCCPVAAIFSSWLELVIETFISVRLEIEFSRYRIGKIQAAQAVRPELIETRIQGD